MNMNKFHPPSNRLISFVLVVIFILSACTAAKPTPTTVPPTDAPEPTDTPEPTNTPEPTEGPPLSEGSFTATLKKEDFQSLGIPESDICEQIGTFTITLLGNVWYMEQTPAAGCTVKDSWGYGSWEPYAKKGIAFHDDFGGGCQNDYTYMWNFDGSQLSLQKGDDNCPGREIILGSHPWIKQATASAIPEKFQNLELWDDATDSTLGKTAGWTNMAELADLNHDGLVDMLFANGGMWNIPGTPELSQVFLNQGPGNLFKEMTESVLGPNKMLADVIKVRDVNGDGNPDIMVGTTFQQQSRLYLGDGSGGFTNVTETNLPQVKASVGDMEFGDVDEDGDLDLVLTDNGEGNLALNSGGRTMLWLNDGSGKFSDATAARMPDILVGLGGEVGFVDVDNDYDLDILIACWWVCKSTFLFQNDGTGTFTDVTSGKMPKINYTVLFENEGKPFRAMDYAFEAMDLNGDGYLDLATLNEEIFTKGRIFINNQQGGFKDATDSLWPASENIKGGGTNIVFLDYDSDGDADFIIGTSSNPGRLLENDGSGKLTVSVKVFAGKSVATGHFIAVTDLDGDHKLDVVLALGSPNYETAPFPERVFLAKDIQPDTAPPIITLVEQVAAPEAGQTIQIRARVHDNKSPTMPQDWQSVTLKWTAGEQTGEVLMQWYGEYLWRAVIDDGGPRPEDGKMSYQVCATDAAGNQACSEMVDVEVK